MAMNQTQAGVGITISAVDRASAAFKSIRSSFASFRKGFKERTEIKDPMMQGIFKGLVGAGLKKTGKALVGINETILSQTSDIRTAMRQIKAATGASAEELQRMKATVASRGVAEMGWTANQTAQALGQLAKETNSVAEAEGFLIPTLRFARMTEQEAAAGAAQLTDLMSIFSQKSDQAAATTDKLAWAMKQFNVTGVEVFDMYRGAASGANLANQSFEDTTLAIGMMKKVFPDATRAAMAANTALSQLAGDKAQKELHGLGVEVKDKTTGKLRGLSEVLIDVMTKTKDMTEAQRANALAGAFGGRAAGGMSIILDQLTTGVKTNTGETLKGAEAMRYLREQMDASSGEAQKMADALTGSTEKLKAAKSRFAALFMDPANEMRRMVRLPMIRFLNLLADALAAFSPGMRKAILGVVTGLGAMLTVIGSFTVATAVMKAFGISLLGIVWSAVKVVAVFAVLLPLIGGLAIGFYTLYRASKQNVGGVADDWEKLKHKIKIGWQGMIEIFSTGKLSRAMERETRKAGMEGVLKFLEMVERAKVRLKAFWDGLLAGIDEGAKKLGPEMDKLKAKWGWLLKIFEGEAFSDPLATYTESGRKAGVTLAGLGKTAAELLSKLGEMGNSLYESLAGMTAEDFQMAIQDFVWMAQDIADAFAEAFSWLGPIGTVLGFIWDVVETIVRLIGGLIEFLPPAVEALGHFFGLDQGGAKLRPKGAPPETPMERERAFQNYINAQMAQGAGKTIGGIGEIWSKRASSDESRIADLRRREEKFNKFISTPGAQWGEYGMERVVKGATYGQLTEEGRDEIARELRVVQKELRKLHERPIKVDAYMDGKKVGEGINDAGDAENSRDLGGGKSPRTFGAPAPAAAPGR